MGPYPFSCLLKAPWWDLLVWKICWISFWNHYACRLTHFSHFFTFFLHVSRLLLLLSVVQFLIILVVHIIYGYGLSSNKFFFETLGSPKKFGQIFVFWNGMVASGICLSEDVFVMLVAPMIQWHMSAMSQLHPLESNMVPSHCLYALQMFWLLWLFPFF